MKFEKVIRALENGKGLDDWIATQARHRSTEAYLIQNGSSIDVERLSMVKSASAYMYAYVRHDGSLGESSAKVSRKKPLPAQVKDIVAEAMNIRNPVWSLPAPAESYPVVQTADPRVLSRPEECINDIIERLRKSISREKGVIFNSAEVFLTGTESDIRTSKGFSGKEDRTKLYLEIAFSRHEDDGRADEFLHTGYATSFTELDVERLVAEAAERARNITRVEMPNAGNYQVIVGAGVISQLFHGIVSHTSGSYEYYGYPHKKIGEHLIEAPNGDLVSIVLDPMLPMGAESTGFSSDGTSARKLELVKDNKVVGTILDKKIADYLGRTANCGEGNLVLSPGSMPYEEMAADGVIEILEFSSLNDNALRGDFSSEIRLARMFKDGGMVYLKGGCLAGNLFEALKDARFATQTQLHTGFDLYGTGLGYSGPTHMLFNASISGK